MVINIEKQVNKRKKKSNFSKFIIFLLLFTACFAVAIYIFINSFLSTGDMGKISAEHSANSGIISDELNILVLGIDYTESDAHIVERDKNGQTDMLMYVQLNFSDNSINMMQIPRDLFMGDIYATGGTGKVNAIYRLSEGENKINTLAGAVSDTLKIPIDCYVALDMQSLTELVDILGGIEVYVAEEHSFNGSYLSAGLHNLSGASLEFFLRDRSGATGDIGRLDTQRYFYSALLKRLQTTTFEEIIDIAPLINKYINTDITTIEGIQAALLAMEIESENIMVCRLPTYNSTNYYNGQYSVQVADSAQTALLLNEYFLEDDEQIDVNTYSLPYLEHSQYGYGTNIQWMSGF